MDTIYINHPCKTKFKISSNDKRLIKYLQIKYCAQSFPDYGHKYKQIIVEQDDNNPNLFYLFYENKKYSINNPLAYVCNLMYAKQAFVKDVFALHGAAIEYDNLAYIFLAQTQAGKSTLTAFLALNGLGYITDDCVMIDLNTLKVIPDFTPISLREGGCQVLNDIGYSTDVFEVLDYPPLTGYAYMPSKSTDKPKEIGAIFFIKRSDENSLAGMSCTESMLSLLKAPITKYDLNKEHIQIIKALASFPCYKLCYSDMEYVLKIITNEKQNDY